MRRRAQVSALLLPLLLGACAYQHYQSDFGSAASEDRQFLTLFWIFLAVCAVMYALVIGFLTAGIIRRGPKRTWWRPAATMSRTL
jgi:hypothetical protein